MTKKQITSIMTHFYKHYCVNVLFPENNFYSEVNCFTRLMLLSQSLGQISFVVVLALALIPVRRQFWKIYILRILAHPKILG